VRSRTLWALLGCLLFAWQARALNDGLGEVAKDIDRSSPFATVQGFLSEARHGHFAAAAQDLWLDHLPQAQQPAQGARLARRLRFVLDRQPLDLVALPKEGEGGPGAVTLTTLDVDGRPTPVRLVRVRVGDAPVWVFSRDTVRAIDGLYDEYGPPLGERMPGFLFMTRFGLELWQWLGVLLGFLLALLVGWLAEKVLLGLVGRFTRLTRLNWDDELVRAAHGAGFTVVDLRTQAEWLRALGIDWDFAPVLDVDTNPDNPVIADRALGSDAEQVAILGVALARGLEDGGVASCAKHFPGHGDTHQDSHSTLPILAHSMERLRAVELVPFRRYAVAGLASVMTAHVRFPALGEELPATMSRRVLTELLRGELGFRGVCVSDDLEMKAISEHMGVEEATVEGARAGVDVFLVCESVDVQRRCLEALVRAVEAGHVSRQRIAEAHQRIDALVARFAQAPGGNVESLGSAEHRLLAEGLSSEAFAGPDPTERSVS